MREVRRSIQVHVLWRRSFDQRKITSSGVGVGAYNSLQSSGCWHEARHFFSGAIGAGKSTIGRALAEKLVGLHVEGDDHQQPPKPWYATSLSTSRGILQEVLEKLQLRRTIVVSYPLRCFEWIYYRRHLANRGVSSIFITLAASFDATVDPSRGRAFSEWEKARIREMLDQGYDRSSFSDLTISSEGEPPAAIVQKVSTWLVGNAR